MTGVAILGAGAFGRALAVTMAQNGQVILWGRNVRTGQDALPCKVTLTGDLALAARTETILLAIPTQALSGFLAENAALLKGKSLVACCKGVDLTSGLGASSLIALHCPTASAAVLTGPGFAADLTRGQPTAMTLACTDDVTGAALQHQLSTQNLRLYRTTDVTGAEIGGALKNVIAIAAGVVIGAGLGESARAALITRGHAEMVRLAVSLGAREETLAGLSGLGDLVLTCTSDMSRNFRYGRALGAGQSQAGFGTVEGVATAKAAAALAHRQNVATPVTDMVAALVDGTATLTDAVRDLMTRPLKEE